MAEISLETTLTVDGSANPTLTVYEDTDNDGTANNTASQVIEPGTNTYVFQNLDGGAGNDYWFKLERPSSIDEGIRLDKVKLSSRTGVSATVTGLSTDTPDPGVNPTGTATINAPQTALSAPEAIPDLTPDAGIPEQQTSLSTPSADVNPGTVTISAPTTSLSSSTPNATAGGSGNVTISAPESSISSSSKAPLFTPGGEVDIIPPVTDISTGVDNPGVSPENAGTINPPATQLTSSTPSPSELKSKPAEIAAPATDVSVGTAGHSAYWTGTGIIAAPVTELNTTTPDVGFGQKSWKSDTESMGDIISEVRTNKKLRFSIRASDTTYDNVLLPLQKEAGEVEIVTYVDGGFSAVDRSDSGIATTLTPPSERTILRRKGTFYPNSFQSVELNQEGKDHAVDLEFFADTQREPTGDEVSESRSSGEWLFELSKGDVATSSVRMGSETATAKGVETEQVILHLTEAQTLTLETSASHLDAVQVFEVPDGQNYAEDNNTNDRNTVTVTSPNGSSGNVLPSDTYIVVKWKTRWLSNARWEVTLDLLKEGAP